MGCAGFRVWATAGWWRWLGDSAVSGIGERNGPDCLVAKDHIGAVRGWGNSWLDGGGSLKT